MATTKKATRKVVKTPKVDMTILDSWARLNEAVGELTEEQALALLEAEKEGGARPTFLIRLHMRYNKMRGAREKRELLS